LLGGFISDHLHWSVIFWINIPMGLAALAMTGSLLRRLPRHERPHRLDFAGAVLIVIASVSFMLALNLAGVRYPWLSLPILALLAAAAIVGALFVLRLRTAPEPLIPISILHDPIVRWAIIGNACGWGAIIGLNVLLPIYLQGVMGLSPTQAGLSLVMFLVAMNTSAGVAGQVLGRVRHYKRLPIALLSLAIAAVILLGWYADRVTPLAFELLVILIGAGFGPVPSLTAVAMQNVVSRHQFGISIGAMNFSRNLYATMLIAVFGAIVLASAQTRDAMDGAAAAAAQNAAQGFASVFFIAAASFAIALMAIVRLEEKPLRAGGEGDVE
jgi:MFS family permease